MTVTPRQLEAVSAYLATGSIKGAADTLGVSPHTLARHLSDARHRIGVETSVQLVHVLTATGRLAWHQTATMRDAHDGWTMVIVQDCRMDTPARPGQPSPPAGPPAP